MIRSGGVPAARGVCAVALVAAAAGCLDFVEPTPGPGRLVVVLRVTDGDPVRSELDATFDPGADPEGEFRTVDEPSLRVLGRKIQRAPLPPAGPLEYRDEWTVPSDLLDRSTLDLEGPRLHAGRSRLTAPVPLVWRSGLRSIELAGGEDLALPLRGVPDTIEGERTWSLAVRRADGGSTPYVAAGTGTLPDTFRVQADVFADIDEPETLEARLDVNLQRRVPPRQDPGYGARVHLQLRIGWRVEYDPGER